MSEPILLGLIDEEYRLNSKTSWNTNKIGGVPDFMQHYEIPHCRICNGDNLIHVCQIYCPIGYSSYHRTLNIFACRNKKCWNNRESWFVLRSQLLDDNIFETTQQEEKSKQKKAFSNTSTNDDWGVDANDWGEENDDTKDQTVPEDIISAVTDKSERSASDKTSEDKEIVDLGIRTSLMSMDHHEDITDHSADCIRERVSLCPENQSIKPYLHISKDPILIDKSETFSLGKNNTAINNSNLNYTLYFLPYYVNVFEEPIQDQTAPLHHENKLLMDYVKREGIDLKTILNHRNYDEGEKYEKSFVKHGDDIFYKFTKRVAQCPKQILRYQYKGKPLLMKELQGTVPSCNSCGKPREFELQLMPALVNVLKPQNIDLQHKDCLLEFGTVLIYTCVDSCWEENKCRTEYAVVQSDPDQHLFKV